MDQARTTAVNRNTNDTQPVPCRAADIASLMNQSLSALPTLILTVLGIIVLLLKSGSGGG